MLHREALENFVNFNTSVANDCLNTTGWLLRSGYVPPPQSDTVKHYTPPMSCQRSTSLEDLHIPSTRLITTEKILTDLNYPREEQSDDESLQGMMFPDENRVYHFGR